MTAELIFQLASLGRLLLPILITLFALALPLPRNSVVRCFCAVILAWVASVFYTALAYNPAGIAFGQQQGQHFPEASYDNNTISVMLLAGWVIPVVTSMVFFLVRRFWLRRHNVGA